ncbi:hypothetical protein QE380_001889 [Acinetobacter baylyi]|uniref:Uncharacterized protein n=1 Tax=Acinetobacter baylyi TaxID=202950 RepID=A0ABU0UWM7_ACIBI|nr:DUF6035 family protein [Acinetobacter baylyi]MDQ1208966.1 hypothetical protein [Acinetobacter baylyi]MDR6185840.1 hypothetical protein [Acinetobacter baylyi]
MKLVHIIDTDQNMWIDVDVFFQQSEMELNLWRSKISEQYKRDNNNPYFTCAWCQTPVILARRTDHMQINTSATFFFRHIPELENNPNFKCPVKNIKQLSENEKTALKYQIAKETQQHKSLKENIYKSLQADEAFGDIHIEQVRKSIDLKQWRRPDVSAFYRKQLVVFEAQLSTTFLNVIIDRKIFYQDNNACLLWIFNHFEPTEKAKKQSMQDIYYNNNANAFVVNDSTVAQSIKAKVFTLECHYLKPEIQNNQIINKWNIELVEFQSLVHNESTKQIYFFDYEAEYRKLKQKLGLQQSYLQESKNQKDKLKVKKYLESMEHIGLEPKVPSKTKSELLVEFTQLWVKTHYLTDNQFNCEWFSIRKELELMGITTPKYPLQAPFKTVINSILSAKFGYAVGNNISDMVSVAHNLMEHHPLYIKHFMLTLKVTGKPNLLNERDISGKWRERYKKYTQQSEEIKMYKHDLNQFIEFLVPEFEGRLISWGENSEYIKK